jgi:hypothetical protein
MPDPIMSANPSPSAMTCIGQSDSLWRSSNRYQVRGANIKKSARE